MQARRASEAGEPSLLASFAEQYENPMKNRSKKANLICGSVLSALPFLYVGFLFLPTDVRYALVSVVSIMLLSFSLFASFICGLAMLREGFKQ
jgi:hypothetical protein